MNIILDFQEPCNLSEMKAHEQDIEELLDNDKTPYKNSPVIMKT